MNRLFFFLATLVLLVGSLPQEVLAAVQITEVMYDVSGSDTNREWIEITNTGSSAVDVSGYRLYEANTNHALTLVSGSATLTAGASAVIVDDVAKFTVDWPQFSGTVFDASFDLSNTGETLALKDSSLSVLDTVSYSSSMGAAGDGTSLSRIGSSFSPASPTPWMYGSGASVSPGTVSGSVQTQLLSPERSVNQTTAVVTAPTLTVHIDTARTSFVGGGAFFTGEAFLVDGRPLTSARYLWNFGDGTTAEGMSVFHTYTYVGVYDVALTVAYNFSEGTARTAVEVIPTHVSLFVEDDGSLTIGNDTDAPLDVGLWRLVYGTSSFLIPKHTVVLAGGGIRFAPQVLQFMVREGTYADATLLYPNGVIAAYGDVGIHSKLRGEQVSRTPTPLVSKITEPTSVGVVRGAAVVKKEVPPQTKDTTSVPMLWWTILGLLALISVGVAGVLYARQVGGETTETYPSADEFEIEEDTP